MPASLKVATICQPRAWAISVSLAVLVLDGLLVGRYADVDCGSFLHDALPICECIMAESHPAINCLSDE
jgi:hypothetical protein